jgi:hypothetical protein
MTEKEATEVVGNQLIAIINRITPLLKNKVTTNFEVTFEYEGRKYTLTLKRHFAIGRLLNFKV